MPLKLRYTALPLTLIYALQLYGQSSVTKQDILGSAMWL